VPSLGFFVFADREFRNRCIAITATRIAMPSKAACPEEFSQAARFDGRMINRHAARPFGSARKQIPIVSDGAQHAAPEHWPLITDHCHVYRRKLLFAAAIAR
jgi:hypothetical protein